MSSPGESQQRWSAAGPPLRGRSLMRQDWRDAVFVHWRVAPERVGPLLPRGVRPDVFDGSAWVGLIPFRMVDAGFGVGPPVPVLGDFLEENVRTYGIDAHGRRGVVFLSLDTPSLAATLGARLTFNVPYQWARMEFRRDGGLVTYTVRRHARPGRQGPVSRLTVRIGDEVSDAAAPTPVVSGDPVSGDPASDSRASRDLEVFLTARFGLHTRRFARTWWVPNTHTAWPLHRADIADLDDELVGAAGFPELARTRPDSVLYSPGVHTRFGFPQLLPRATGG